MRSVWCGDKIPVLKVHSNTLLEWCVDDVREVSMNDARDTVKILKIIFNLIKNKEQHRWQSVEMWAFKIKKWFPQKNNVHKRSDWYGEELTYAKQNN